MPMSAHGSDPPGCGWMHLRCRVLPRRPSPSPRTPTRQSGFLETSAAILRSLSELDDRRRTVTRAAPQNLAALPTNVGSIIRPPKPAQPQQPVVCRALSRRVDPEVLKEMGNREYRKGRFVEAIALYDRAIAVDGRRAAYWSNKAAALAGLGKLLEAVDVCREAVRIDASFFRAHRRLADLYLRLGDTVKALHHYQLSGGESGSEDFNKLRALRSHVSNANDARKHKDWQMVLDETNSAMSLGVDSAPQVFASQAEALLKLQRHQEAAKVLAGAPTFDADSAIKFFGAPTNAYVLSVQAQVDLALGRFDEAVEVADRAMRLDPTNKELAVVVRRTKAVSVARLRGNELFNQCKFKEACAAYQAGLEHEPCNSVLLCNRAASLAKLGLWEEAVADCDEALKARPSYYKARLRRAECYFKMKKWEEAIHDYEIVMKESPGSEEISRMLWEARFQLMKERKAKP